MSKSNSKKNTNRDGKNEKKSNFIGENMSFMHKLNNYQVDVLAECIERKNTGIDLPMGAGKTRLSLILSLEVNNGKILVVCSKSLIREWIVEIREVFEGEIDYFVYHKELNKDFDNIESIDDIQERIVITTPEVCRKFYKDLNLEQTLITRRLENEGQFGEHEVLDYNLITEPIEDGGLLYGTNWGSIIIDEFHQVSGITSDKCRAILSLVGERKWALSGTFFTTPKAERILPYFLFIQEEGFPNNVPDMSRKIRNDFDGLQKYIVKRESVPIEIRTSKKRITVNFNENERKIYLAFRNIVLDMSKLLKEYKKQGRKDEVKKINGYILGAVVYLRECIVNPLVPLASVFLRISELENRDEMNRILRNNLDQLDIQDYLADPENIKSERLKEALRIIKRNDRVVLFTPFRKNIDLLKHFVTDRDFFNLEGNMTLPRREREINACKESEKFLLTLTYKIGGAGLNLQNCNCVIFLDYDWSVSDTHQAESRVVRQGQTQKVKIYYLVSNTGIENALLKKQLDKSEAIKELSTGTMKTEVETFKIDEIITLLEQEVLDEKMSKLYV